MIDAPDSLLVIAEVGSVHDGSLGNALKLVDVAADAGADAVKFQTHIPDAETLPDALSPSYFTAEPRYAYFKRTGFDLSQWRQIEGRCRERGIEFMSSPFSEEAVDLLEYVGLARYKIPSGEITNLPLLEKIARLGKPVLLSSGMSSWHELDAAVETVKRVGAPLTVLQCTSEYPCPPEHVGLNVMLEMKARYGVPVGLSDHTLTFSASFAAAALGASVIERHLTFSRAMYGSDARHSLEPSEMAAVVRGLKEIEIMRRARVEKDDVSRFGDMKRVFQKSIVTVKPIAKGDVIPREALGFRKPGTGLEPARLREIVGRRATRELPAGTILSTADVVEGEQRTS